MKKLLNKALTLHLALRNGPKRIALGDCRKARCQLGSDFCLPSRHDSSRVVGYVTAGATPKVGKKSSKMEFSLTKIALSVRFT